MPRESEFGVKDGRVSVEPRIDQDGECAGLRRVTQRSSFERGEGEEEGGVCSRHLEGDVDAEAGESIPPFKCLTLKDMAREVTEERRSIDEEGA